MNKEDKKPHAIDILVGRNIRRIRDMRDLSQTDLGAAIGVTFQQIQKIEKGSNRIAASRMFLAAQYLRCNVADFYKGADEIDVVSVDPQLTKEALSIATIFDKITTPGVKAAIMKLVRVIGKDEAE